MSPVPGLFQDGWAALRGRGPASFARLWPRELRKAFPGPRQLIEAWHGDGASFARYRTPQGPVFLKFLPAGEREERYLRRLTREITYLRDLAPLVDVPHAPLLHWGLDTERCRAHLLTPDLTEDTYGWGHFRTDAEREQGLHDVARLLAHFHASWQRHPALSGDWRWSGERVGEEGATWARRYAGAHAGPVQEAGAALPGLLAAAPTWTLAHGDIHSGQVLWPRGGSAPRLIDYGQVHPSIPGEDLAHLLAVRLSVEERARYGPSIRATYWAELARRGLTPSPDEQAAQERAGVALNLLSTARQARREPGSGVQEALEHVAAAWQEELAPKGG